MRPEGIKVLARNENLPCAGAEADPMPAHLRSGGDPPYATADSRPVVPRATRALRLVSLGTWRGVGPDALAGGTIGSPRLSTRPTLGLGHTVDLSRGAGVSEPAALYRQRRIQHLSARDRGSARRSSCRRPVRGHRRSARQMRRSGEGARRASQRSPGQRRRDHRAPRRTHGRVPGAQVRRVPRRPRPPSASPIRRRCVRVSPFRPLDNSWRARSWAACRSARSRR